MDNKKLLIEQPLIIGYQHHAYPLAIMGNNNDQFTPWFFSNFIQLICAKSDTSNHVLNFYVEHLFPQFPPLLNSLLLKKEVVLNYIDPIEFIIDCISRDQYIITFINEYFIPDRNSYQKFDFTHDCFIFGFDKSEKSFDILGFRKDRSFGSSKVSFIDFEMALMNASHKYDMFSYLYLLNKNNEYRFNFEIKVIINQINNYLFPGNYPLLLPNTESYAYGIDIYNYIAIYLENCENHIDIRIFHILWEHKKCMLLRIKYLQDQQYLINTTVYTNYIEIEDFALTLRNLSLKFQITSDKKILKRMTNLVGRMPMIERSILESMLVQLNNLAGVHSHDL